MKSLHEELETLVEASEAYVEAERAIDGFHYDNERPYSFQQMQEQAELVATCMHARNLIEQRIASALALLTTGQEVRQKPMRILIADHKGISQIINIPLWEGVLSGVECDLAGIPAARIRLEYPQPSKVEPGVPLIQPGDKAEGSAEGRDECDSAGAGEGRSGQ